MTDRLIFRRFCCSQVVASHWSRTSAASRQAGVEADESSRPVATATCRASAAHGQRDLRRRFGRGAPGSRERGLGEAGEGPGRAWPRSPRSRRQKIDEIVRPDKVFHAGRPDPLVVPDDGGQGRGVAGDGAAGVGRARVETAPGRDIQAVHRPEVRGETDRRGRSVPRSSREGDRAVHGREVLGAGAGPDPAVAAHEAGAGADDDPRLQAQRHRHVVRGAGRADRHSYRAMPAPAPP